MHRYLILLLSIGLAWGHENSPYFPKIDLFGLDVLTWHILGWFNIFSGKIVLIYYGYKKGWDVLQWLTLILFATTGAAIGSLVLPSIVGVLFGFIGCLFLGKRFLGFHHDLGIIVALFIATAFAIGRLGCLINGCCFGSETVLPWGINYPIGSPAHWLHLSIGSIPNDYLSSLTIHPIQLYETTFHLFSAIFIVKLGKRFKNTNTVLLSYFGSYLIFRFFIEFIRDMNNIWWSALSFGSLSLLQWFLFSIGLGIIICGLILEKTYKPIPNKLRTSYFLKNNFIIILGCLVATIIFKNQIQTIHLVQLVIILPISTFLYLLEVKKRYTIFNSIPRFASISIIVFSFSTPIISQIESRLNHNTSIKPKLQRNNKAWIYAIDYNNKSLVRIGDKKLNSFQLNTRMKILNTNDIGLTDLIKSENLFIKDSISKGTLDEISKNSLKNSNSITEDFFGSIGGGLHRFEISACGSSTTYTVTNIGGAIGKEKKDITGERILYSGYRGNIYLSSLYEGNRHNYNRIASLHLYTNTDESLAGFGLGISSLISAFPTPVFDNLYTESGILIYPNFHLRIGPRNFNLQAGISDRYHNILNPMAAHVSLGLKNNVRVGLTNQTPEYPLMTAGFFIDNNKSYFMVGGSGISFGKKINF